MSNKSEKNIVEKILNIFELVLPTCTFLIMLTSFVLGIFFRYVLKNPLSWTNEVCSISFVWTVLFGASYAQRKRTHVAFTVLYDVFPLKLKAFCTFFGNALIAGTFIICFFPVWKQILSIMETTTSMLRIPLTYVHLPFMFFLLTNIIYLTYDAFGAFLITFNLGSEKLRGRFLDNYKTEVDKALEESAAMEELDINAIFGEEGK